MAFGLKRQCLQSTGTSGSQIRNISIPFTKDTYHLDLLTNNKKLYKNNLFVSPNRSYFRKLIQWSHMVCRNIYINFVVQVSIPKMDTHDLESHYPKLLSPQFWLSEKKKKAKSLQIMGKLIIKQVHFQCGVF